MIQLSSLSKSFGDRILLEAVNWQIDDRERVGLSGPNGAGKTTLLKMLAGLDEPDSGLVVKPSGLTIGYLPQDGLHHTGRTLREEAGLAFKTLLDMRAEIASLEERLGDDAVPESEHAEMLTRYSELQDEFRRREGYSIDLKITTVLRGLGFSADDMDQAERDVLRRLADAHRAREAAARHGPVCSCSTSRRTTSISTRATGSRSTSRATRTPSSSSRTTVSSSTRSSRASPKSGCAS